METTTHTITLSYEQVKLVRYALIKHHNFIDCLPITQIDATNKAAALAEIDAIIAQLHAIGEARHLRNRAIEVAK